MSRSRISTAVVSLSLVAGAVVFGGSVDAAKPKPTTTRISVDSDGKQANCQSVDGAMNGNGRFVVFNSCANNLVKTSTAPWGQVYLRDRTARKTRLLSQNVKGQAGDRDSVNPTVSENGRYVVFASSAGNLGVGNPNFVRQVLRLDRQSGKFARVSVNRKTGGAPNASSGEAHSAVSDNGRFVAFVSRATNLVKAPDKSDTTDVYLRDMREHETFLVSRTMTGDAAGGGNVGISANGRYVVFDSFSDEITADDTISGQDSFLYDRVSKTFVNLSRNAIFNGYPQAGGSAVTISGNADEVCFTGSGGAGDFYYQIWCTNMSYAGGVPQTPTAYVKVTAVPNGPNGDSGHPVLNRGGGWVAFASSATNLGPHDTNKSSDVYLAQIGGAISRVSVTYRGKQSDQGVSQYTIDISDHAGTLLFDSPSTNLVKNDTNSAVDLFIRTR